MILSTDQEREVRALAAQVAQGWGEPTAILQGSRDDEYVVLYKTPQPELDVLGERAVLVNLQQKTVEVPLRD